MLPNYNVERKTGRERIIVQGEACGPTLLEFWQWASSDLLSNSLRGIFAEFVVASAIGLIDRTRIEWDGIDLEMPCGMRLEVKSAAYLQSWEQMAHSRIAFSIRETNGWTSKTNSFSEVRSRQSDAYVFCLLHCLDKVIVNPLDTSQWTFFIVNTSEINSRVSSQKSISLARLKKLKHTQCTYVELRDCLSSHKS